MRSHAGHNTLGRTARVDQEGEKWISVTVAYLDDKYADRSVDHVPEAVGITGREMYGPPMDEVRPEILDAIAPNYYYLEDTRRRTNWGATSPLAQDLILSVGGSVLGVGIVNSVKLVAARVRSTHLNQDRPEREPEHVWNAFTDLAERAFRARKLRCKEITKKAKYWYLTADCDGREIEAKLSLDGVVVFARWKPYEPETSELPDPD
jgi:hypothetical protein